MSRRAGALLVAFLICVSAAAGRAGDASAPLVLWRLDPSRFGEADAGAKARAAAEAGLRVAAASGVIADDDTLQLVHALLAASAVGGVPHTLVIEEMALRRDAGSGATALERIRAVLHLEVRGQHAELVRNIQTILVDAAAEGAGAAEQRPLELPGGRKGVAFRRAGWSEAREVSWSSHEGGFTVGLGRDALKAWFDGWKDAAPEAVALHRLAVSDGPGQDGARFFELFVDLNALRHALEPLSDEDVVTPLLTALHLANARDVMLHGTWSGGGPEEPGPPLLVFHASWSLRSRPPGVVNRLRATASRWPASFALPAPPSPPARYAIVAELDAGSVVRQGIGLYAGALSPPERREFALARSRWERRHSAELRRVLASLENHVVLSDHPRPVVAVPGATTVFAPLKPGVDRVRFERDLQDVLSAFSDLVVWDEQELAWSLYLDEKRLVRIATWGLAETQEGRHTRLVLVGGFDLTLGEGTPSALLRLNRRWLEAAAP